MAALPSYASIHLDGYAEQRESALMRTEMESGPPKQAKIKSRVMVTRPVTIRVNTLADYQAFVVWFSDTINEGADWFDWLDPISNTTKQARIQGGALDASPMGSINGAWVMRAKLETWG